MITYKQDFLSETPDITCKSVQTLAHCTNFIGEATEAEMARLSCVKERL